jgi:hypothetical protein
MSRFRVHILDTETGAEAALLPGGRGERDLVDAVLAAIVKRGVGIFRTEAHVAQAIQEGMQEALFALKSEVLPPVPAPRVRATVPPPPPPEPNSPAEE